MGVSEVFDGVRHAITGAGMRSEVWMKREVEASNAVFKGKGIRHEQFCMARFSERSMRGSDDQSPPLTPSAAG